MRVHRRITTTAALLALLAPALADQAQAASKPFPHVTMAAAEAALPAHMTVLKLLRLHTSTTRKPTTYPGCHDAPIPFHNWGEADAFYVWNTPPQDSIDLFAGVFVFRTPAQAAAAATTLVANGLSCPKAYSEGPASARWHYTTSVQAPYTSGAWHGYRSAEVGVISTKAQRDQRYRFFTSWLTQGNVLLYVEEQVTDSPDRGEIQLGWQLQAQQHILTALSR